MPIVLTTVGVACGFNQPAVPSIQSEPEDVEPIDRSSMSAFEDAAFSAAVEDTGRKRLIIGGLDTQMCVSFSSVQALKSGYDVLCVTDRRGRAVVAGVSSHRHRVPRTRRGRSDHRNERKIDG